MREFRSVCGVLCCLWSAALALPVPAQPVSPGARPRTPVPAVVMAQDTLDPVPRAIDHSLFDALLREHVSKGLVDYGAFRNNAGFARYLASLDTVKLDGYEEPERIAFWLNVYNAFTIQLVASHGETASIRNIEKTLGLFRLKGPWSHPFVKAAGRTLTLDEVEHRILRHDFSEPRVHFAMSFATLGGPPLRSEAYTGARLDDQLEDQARIFLRESPAKNRVDTARYTLYASPILLRYRADFGESPNALGTFLSDYYPEGAERRLLRPRPAAPVRPVSASPPAPGTPAATPGGTPAGGTPPAGRGTIAAGGAPRTDTMRPAPQSRLPRVRFRIQETAFDWGLNIRPKPRP